MEHFESEFKGCGGLRLYYQGWRPDGKPKGVLPIVHGFGEHSGRYENVVKHLVQAVSKRETGRPVFLFGHSLGGLIVLEYALHYPEGLRGVIVSGAALSQTA